MGLLVLAYMAMTLIVGGFMLFDGMPWGGLAVIIGSLLGFAGGSGMRGSFYAGNRKSGLIIGAGLLIASMGLVFYSDVSLQIFSLELAGDVWVFVGFVVGYFAAKPEDAGVGPNVPAEQ